MVFRFTFPNDLDTLIQHQHEGIVKKDKSQVQVQKWGAISYRDSRESSGILEGQGIIVRFNIPQLHKGKLSLQG